MTVLIVDTALPLAQGTPRQRCSAARRDFFAQTGEVRHLTIDIYGTEHAARYQRGVGDWFVGQLGFGGHPGFGSQPGLGGHPGREPRREPAFPRADLAASWLSPRRRDHLRAVLARHRPARIVVGDALLAPLMPILATAYCPVHAFEDGAARWHAHAALRQTRPDAVEYHRNMAVQIRSGAKELAMLNALTLMQTPSPAFAGDEAFFAKTSTVLALATGHAAADEATVAHLAEAVDRLRTQGHAGFEVLLMGFPAAVAARIPDSSAFADFVHLAGMAGAVRCAVLPWLSPELAILAREFLLVGTPVVTFDTERIPAPLAGGEGLILTDPPGLAGVIELLLDDQIVDAPHWRAIAAAQQARLETPPVATGSLPGAGVRVAPAPRRPVRIRPLLERPEVFYNPLSFNLLVRMRWRAGTAVEEVRLLDEAGTELNRLMPNAREKQLDPVQIEGGLVIDLATLGRGIEIQLHGVDGLIERDFIPASDFLMLEAELAWLKREEGLLTGAFWVSDALDSSGWALDSGGVQIEAMFAKTTALPEIGGAVLRFTAQPEGIAPRVPVTLHHWVPGIVSRFELLEQRRLVPTPMLAPPMMAAPPAPGSEALEALRDRHAGKRAWVIGNGPSVRLEDLAAIPADDIKFCFNRFYLSHDTHPLRETYVVSADTLMIKDFGQDMIERSPGLPLFCIKPDMAPTLNGAHVIVPPYDGYLPLFSMDPQSWVGVGGSSVYVALQMAHFMGLRDIVLYGIDYSFSMKLRRDPRFPFPVSFDDGNHFIKSYRSAKPWCPPTWRDISAGFLNARVAFESTGGRIRNATRGGRLETFERVDFEALVTADPGGDPARDDPHALPGTATGKPRAVRRPRAKAS